jgi:hypothetical protein
VAKKPYEIGYGRPPLRRRFKPGRSGNPKGRPKGKRNMRAAIESALNQPIKIREGDSVRSLSKRDGIVLTILNKALQGDAKAWTALIQLIRSVGITDEIPEPAGNEPVTACDQEIIADFLRRHGASTHSAPENEFEEKPTIPRKMRTKQ